MNPIYQPYSSLSAGQRELLCFLAYTGRKTDEQILSLYRHAEELNAAQLDKLIKVCVFSTIRNSIAIVTNISCTLFILLP